MPAIVTHHLFGLEAYSKLAPIIGASEAEREAFLLGNVGPDALFCLKALPKSVPYRRLGWSIHQDDPTVLFTALHRHLVKRREDAGRAGERRASRAFALGFLCHYLLDSTAHPLIYAQQFALCDAGIPGLTRDEGCRETHAVIETEIDEYMLMEKLGVTVTDFAPHRETLRCPEAALSALSRDFALAAEDTYRISVPHSTYALSVKMYRIVQKALDSKRDGLRSHVDYARIAGKAYLHIGALTHTGRVVNDTPFANHDCFPWPHPFTQGSTITASFDDLYALAQERATAALPAFARDDFTVEDCQALTQGINFRGAK